MTEVDDNKSASERFHIAEWYGQPFLDLSDTERTEFAIYKVGKVMPKAEVARLNFLEEKARSGVLSRREGARRTALREKLDDQNRRLKPCPFRTDVRNPVCTKPGGVCSLRLYRRESEGLAEVTGDRGRIRALCPYRFHENNTVFRHLGQELLGDSEPEQIGEVGFLRSTGNLDSKVGDDVGRIDMVLAKSNA